MDTLEELGRVLQVGDRELEEDPLIDVGADALRLGTRGDLADLLVVGVTGANRLFEDLRVRRKSGDRELLEVALQDAVA